MSAYRTLPPIEPYPVADPFPCIVCRDCGRSTTRVRKETRCARCDYRYLMKRPPLSETTTNLILLVVVMGLEFGLVALCFWLEGLRHR